MELAVHRVVRHVLERVVHPSHVPLEAEPQAPDVGRAGDHGPGRGLLSLGLDGRLLLIHGLVELPQESDRVQVLSAPVFVGDPFARLARVVQIQHRRHRIHPEPVRVIGGQPVHGRGEEEAPHLVAAVVEDVAVPVGMDALPRVGVLEEVGAVEEAQAVLVVREVRRDPVQDHADAVLMEVVDQEHEVLRGPVPGGGGEIARGLVAP